jgi:xylulokinase
LDLGTQSLKAVVLDEAFALRGEASRAYGTRFPAAQQAEQNPQDWIDALQPAIAEALAQARLSPDAIAAIGIGGQLDGCIGVDGDGKAVGPALIWMDRRAELALSPEQMATLHERTGLVPDPSHMAAKIRWMKRHAPEAARLRRFHQPVSYLVACLTGQAVFDPGLASTTMVFNLADRRFDETLLGYFGIGIEELPQVAPADSVAGGLTGQGARLTGLLPGTPVVVGTGDDYSNPLGCGAIRPGQVVCSLGTAEVVGAAHDAPVIDPGRLVETHGYYEDRYFIENPGWLAGGSLNWIMGITQIASTADLNGLAAESAPCPDGLIFLPALSGAMTPQWIPSARGAFYGLSTAHGRGHLARAVLEGCAFAMRDIIERLDLLGVDTSEIVLFGGGARSALWAQIRADVAGRPVRVNEGADCSAVGAALLAARAVTDRTLSELSDKIANFGATYFPDPRRQAIYDDGYARYRRLFAALQPMFEVV